MDGCRSLQLQMTIGRLGANKIILLMNKGLKWNTVLSFSSLYRMICTIYASKKIDCLSFQLPKTTQAQFVVNLIAVIVSHRASQDLTDVMTTCSRERFPYFRDTNPNPNHSFLCKILIQIIFFRSESLVRSDGPNVSLHKQASSRHKFLTVRTNCLSIEQIVLRANKLF